MSKFSAHMAALLKLCTCEVRSVNTFSSGLRNKQLILQVVSRIVSQWISSSRSICFGRTGRKYSEVNY
jgi:hypothetical protein